MSDARQNEEQPDVHANHLEQLEEQFATDISTQVKGAIDDNQQELDEQHDEKGHGHLTEEIPPLSAVNPNGLLTLFSLMVCTTFPPARS